MSGYAHVPSDEAVNVRDSWDLLETPRTAESDTDEPILSRPVVNIQHLHESVAEHSYDNKKRGRKANIHKHDIDDDRKLKPRVHLRKPTSSSLGTSSQNKLTTDTSYCSGLLDPTRPVSAKSFSDVPKVIPRRYRRLGLRSHDDMLKEQVDQLRRLLDDTENMSNEELNRQHIAQTTNMIAVDGRGRPLHNYYADYKAANGTQRTRGIIISRSLPESLRPKSPLSSSGSSFNSSKGSPRYGSSHSPSPDRRVSKKVSFKSHKRRENGQRTSLGTKSLTSQSTTSFTYKKDQLWFEEPHSEEQSKHSASSRDSSASSSCSEYDEIDQVSEFNSRSKSSNSSFQTQQCKRSTKHHYLSDVGNRQTDSNGRKKDSNEQNGSVVGLPDLDTHTDHVKYGTYKNIDGHKHSDNNLRRTSNPDIKQWLKRKEKAIREMKKKQKQLEKRKQVSEDKERQKKEERRAESAKQMRKWQANKRKQAKLLRRENQAKRKIEEQIKSVSEADISVSKEAKTRTLDNKKTETLKPTAPTKPRPMSAPSNRRKFVKPKVPLAQVIRNSPDLQERLIVLEKQKKLKHRQSYDEWVKIKEKEKKDVLKVVREQRKKLEKEISEETAKVISEAAKRRSENIRFKGSTANQAEKSAKEEETTSKQPQQASYTWKQDKDQAREQTPYPRVSRHPPTRSTPVSTSSPHQSTKQKPRRPNVEEKIPDNQANPFRNPFKPPKLNRPKSKLEQSGVNGPEFSRFIWDLVNEQENGANRPEPQGADSPEKSPETSTTKDRDELKTPPRPTQSTSPIPPKNGRSSPNNDLAKTKVNEPVIENGQTIFSMTSIE